jgi:cold shock CspA family protein
VFVNIRAVEGAGFGGINEGDRISYEFVVERVRGKSSAVNLQPQ